MKIFRYSILIFILHFSVIHLIAQSNSPIIGYDRVTWGSTVQTVNQTYSGLVERNSENSSIGVREFVHKNVGSTIISRVFYFYNNQLYRVFVDYGNEVQNSIAEALLDRIVSIYGKFDDDNEKTDGSARIYSLIRNYNKNLRIYVNVVEIFNSFNRLEGTGIGVVYYDPTIQEQIDTANRRRISNEIEL